MLDPIFGIDAAALTAGAVTFTEDANEAYRYCPKLATGMVFSILDE
ncbi:MAG: hypothetical protein O3A10_16680 [Chloroflexi bacterium]|nr:hypothetical protein [Chloroflexota bacterium]MDA1148235.1 hypothetical protein [Chloroflexota bacterium]